MPQAVWRSHVVHDREHGERHIPWVQLSAPSASRGQQARAPSAQALTSPSPGPPSPQIASYWAMYTVARHTTYQTRMPWHWYLYRAGRTALKLGRAGVGFMDGTVAREVRSTERLAPSPLPPLTRPRLPPSYGLFSPPLTRPRFLTEGTRRTAHRGRRWQHDLGIHRGDAARQHARTAAALGWHPLPVR